MPNRIVTYEEFLNLDQQIDLLKSLGISFRLNYSEDEAKAYLRTSNSFFRISSYCDSFEHRRNADGTCTFENLDFQHLVDLSTIDFHLREQLLHIVIHIEHHLKLKLKDLLRRYDVDPCAIVKQFSNSGLLHRPLDHLISRASSSDYSRDIYAETAPNVPVWVMLDLLQLGELNSFVAFLRHQDRYKFSEHEKITLADLDFELNSVRSLRNAAAHNSGVLNGLLQKDGKRLSNRIYNELIDAKKAGSYLFGENELEDSRLSRALKDITTSLFLHHDLVTSPGVKKNMAQKLHVLKLRFGKRISYDCGKAVGFSFSFIERSIELWHPLP